MKKRELLARIELLEARIAALEARPVYHPVITVPTPSVQPFTSVSPYLIGGDAPCISSGTITCTTTGMLQN